MKHKRAWFDLETTGINEHGGSVLEFALGFADDGRDGTYELDTIYTAVIHETPALLEASRMDPYVIDMHTRSGLLAEVAASTLSCDDADEILLAALQEVSDKASPKGIQLAGNSVHFDWRWARVHFPKFFACLHHSVYDVSTLIELAATHGVEVPRVPEPAHRAADDVLQSLAYARAVADQMRKAVRR